MPHLQNLSDDGRGAHLVVARLPSQLVGTEFQPSNTRAVQTMLSRLFKKLPLQGRFTISVERCRGRTEMMCAFEHAADADVAAKAVGASGVAPYEGWLSQHSFDLDGHKERRLAAAAGAPGRSHRQASGRDRGQS
jgi:hypothetical protein